MVAYIAPLSEIIRDFEEAGIDITKAGFYDHEAFKEREAENPYYVYNYARFVRSRQYDAKYLTRAERVIRIAAKVLTGELVKDGRHGACVDLSMAFSRILEREGIWNHFVNGSLVIDSPSGRIAGFHSFDFGEQVAGHSWLFAPPFDIVDLTVRQQSYPPSVNRTLIPQTILEKKVTPLTLRASDIFSQGKLEEAFREGIPYSATAFDREPALRHFVPHFPGNAVECNGLVFRYVPIAINASVEPLEGIRNYPMNGRFAVEIYKDSIKPKLSFS